MFSFYQLIGSRRTRGFSLRLFLSLLTALSTVSLLVAVDEAKLTPPKTEATRIPDDKAMAMIKGIDNAKLPPASAKKVDFAQDIKPILRKACLDCHEAEGPMGSFRVDKREFALKGGDYGVAIIPGKSAKSPLIYYVSGLVKDMEMPPKDQGDPLTKAEIGLLRAWIDQGVPWEKTTAAGK